MTDKPHSILGIASFVLALLMFGAFVVAAVSYSFQLDRMFGESFGNDVGLLQISILMLVTIPVHLFGFLLGTVSLFFPNRKKLFPIAGTIANLIFGLAGLIPYLYLAFYSLGRVS